MKRILSALGIALGIFCLLGLAWVGFAGWPLVADAQGATATTDKFVQEMKNDWPEERFAYYASAKLLFINENWKKDLTAIRTHLGPIRAADDPKPGRVVKDPDVPGGFVYEVSCKIECAKGKATIQTAWAKFGDRYQLAMFSVSDQSPPH